MFRRWIFVVGMHRSATTFVGRWLGGQDNCALLRSGEAPDSWAAEGHYLTDVLPHGGDDAEPGSFALTGAARFTEDDAERLGPRLRADWESKRCAPFMVEKSPTHMINSRLLAAVFPHSHFVILTRHPCPVVRATQAMQKSWREPMSVDSLLENWRAAHETMREDLPALRSMAASVTIVRYRDIGWCHNSLSQAFGFTVRQAEGFANCSAEYTDPPLGIPAEVEVEAMRWGHDPYTSILTAALNRQDG